MAGLLSIGLTGINSAQANLATTSHNIANADTPGYNRQRTLVTTNDPHFSGAGYFGQGVRIEGVRRQYDQFLSQQVLNASGRKEEFAAYHAQIAQLDNLLADPSAGLSPALADFFAGVQEVATHPASIPARQALISTAESLAARFQSLDTRLNEIRDVNEGQIASTVESINAYAREIAKMNERIGFAHSVSASTTPANDLLDQRDYLVAELNKLVKVSTVTESDGSLSVSIGSGQALVTGYSAQTLKVDRATPADPWKIQLETPNVPVTLPDSLFSGGQLGGLLKFRSEALDPAREQIGAIAVSVATEFNAQHQLGVALDGTSNGALFFKDLSALAGNPVDLRTAAGQFEVVIENAADIAASGVAGPGISAGGSNNENALELAKLQSRLLMKGNSATFQSAYSQLVSFVGNKTREVQIGEHAQATQLQQALDAQQSLSGVNLDEEAANLLRFQQAYQAAARVMSVAGTLFDEVLSIAR